MRKLVAIRQLVETTGKNRGMRYTLSVEEVPSIEEAVRREKMNHGVGHLDEWEIVTIRFEHGLKVADINSISIRGDLYKTEVWRV